MSSINIEPTAQTIDAMAERMRDCANDLARLAERMRANGDIELAGEAANSVANMIPSLRLDLLVQRPVRALRGQGRS